MYGLELDGILTTALGAREARALPQRVVKYPPYISNPLTNTHHTIQATNILCTSLLFMVLLSLYSRVWKCECTIGRVMDSGIGYVSGFMCAILSWYSYHCAGRKRGPGPSSEEGDGYH